MRPRCPRLVFLCALDAFQLLLGGSCTISYLQERALARPTRWNRSARPDRVAVPSASRVWDPPLPLPSIRWVPRSILGTGIFEVADAVVGDNRRRCRAALQFLIMSKGRQRVSRDCCHFLSFIIVYAHLHWKERNHGRAWSTMADHGRPWSSFRLRLRLVWC